MIQACLSTLIWSPWVFWSLCELLSPWYTNLAILRLQVIKLDRNWFNVCGCCKKPLHDIDSSWNLIFLRFQLLVDLCFPETNTIAFLVESRWRLTPCLSSTEWNPFLLSDQHFFQSTYSSHNLQEHETTFNFISHRTSPTMVYAIF